MATAYIDKLVRLRDNYANLLLLMQESEAAQDRASIDAVFASADTAGVMRPLPDYSLDGTSYSWMGAQTAIQALMEKFDYQIQRMKPYQIRNRGSA